ncbi:hypothetical protein GF376_00160 [Candidatus Peregrinibacteria bacterium]|nr:hypothetical protein [Candidatus Peregrinibacteria bacterium]
MYKKLFIISFAVMLVFTACQTEVENTETVDNNQKETQKESNVPYSTGPSSPPNEDVVPSGPPPTQAVTKKENIKLSLPPQNSSEQE